jgi:spermidine synthase
MLLPLVTLAHVPSARRAAVIGQGSGMSSHALLGDPTLERLVTIEIEPEMLRASRMFYPANRRVFDDPRSTFAIDDARSYFASQGDTYDLILSSPRTRGSAGVSGLFTTEFYGHVARFLRRTVCSASGSISRRSTTDWC